MQRCQGRPGGGFLGLTAASSGPAAEKAPADLDSDLEATGMGRSRDVEEDVPRKRLGRGLQETLQARFGIKGDVRVMQAAEMPVQKSGGGGQPPIEEEGGHNRFERRRQERSALPASRLFTSAEPEECGESAIGRRLSQRPPVDDTGPELR
jgi:hypothetical protein